MSYEKSEFWDAYGEFLLERRAAHLRATRAFAGAVHRCGSMLDLGCGAYASACDLLFPDSYTGVDEIENAGARLREDYALYSKARFIQMDYRSQLPAGEFDAFCSLFSSEATGSAQDNEQLYRRLFAEKGCKFGLVSGFFYRGKERLETVTEAGGLVSYQTLPSLSLLRGDINETRLTISAPSRLFGPDVVEVWRLLEANP